MSRVTHKKLVKESGLAPSASPSPSLVLSPGAPDSGHTGVLSALRPPRGSCESQGLLPLGDFFLPPPPHPFSFLGNLIRTLKAEPS